MSNMTKTLKFIPGTFLEMDDMQGGKKVVMVCKDGVTYWDLLDANEVTPLAVHPSLNPVAIGSFVQFGADKGLQEAARSLIAYLRRQIDSRLDTNPLFVMRALWFIAQKSIGTNFVPDPAMLEWACAQAQLQEQSALRVHKYAEQFCAV